MLSEPRYWIRTAEITNGTLLQDINSTSYSQSRKMQTMQDTEEDHSTSEAYVEHPSGG